MSKNRTLQKTIEKACRNSLREFKSITSVLDKMHIEYSIGGGYILNKVLDEIHGGKRKTNDIDIFIHNSPNVDKMDIIRNFQNVDFQINCSYNDAEQEHGISVSSSNGGPSVNITYFSPAFPNRVWNSPSDVISCFDIGMSQMAVGSDGTIAYTKKCVSDVETNTISFTDSAINSPDVKNLLLNIFRASKYVTQKYAAHVDETLFRLMENMIRSYDFTIKPHEVKGRNHETSSIHDILCHSNSARYSEHPYLNLPVPFVVLPNSYYNETPFSDQVTLLTSFEFVNSDNDVYNSKEKPEIHILDSLDSRKKILEELIAQSMDEKSKLKFEPDISSTFLKTWEHAISAESVVVPLAAAIANSNVDVFKEAGSILFGEVSKEYERKIASLICRDMVNASFLFKEQNPKEQNEFSKERLKHIKEYFKDSSPQLFLSSGFDFIPYKDVLDFKTVATSSALPFSIYEHVKKTLIHKGLNECKNYLKFEDALKIEESYRKYVSDNTMDKNISASDVCFYASNDWKQSRGEYGVFVPDLLDELLWFGAVYNCDVPALEKMLDNGFDVTTMDEKNRTALLIALRSMDIYNQQILNPKYIPVVCCLIKNIGENMDAYMEYDKLLFDVITKDEASKYIFDLCEKKVLQEKRFEINMIVPETNPSSKKNEEICFDR